MRVASTVLDRRSGAPLEPTGHHLLVMGAKVFATHPLPASGEIMIGRGTSVHVKLDDVLASRQHARLRVAAAGIDIEDLGSANGTRLRGEPLLANRPARVLPGEAIAIGTTILMVQPDRARPVPARLCSHAEFEGRVEWECARAEATGVPFAVARIHVDGELAVAAVTAAAARVLRPLDVLAEYAPGEYELLLPGLGPDASAGLIGALGETLVAAGSQVRVGVAVYPRDGAHAGALWASAGERVRTAVDPDAGAGAGDVAPVLEHEAMRRVYGLAERAAAGSINVLILGETGVGKEVLARFVHRTSPRAGKGFVSVNCAALSETLLESELFGHERGAFTGAAQAKIGLLETAPGGTVFLDEVGELPLSLQAKLLRVIEARELTRVGGVRPRKIDVRFVAATNRDIEADVGRGAFRRDLYFRLNGMTLTIPPLRERPVEIARLAGVFVAELCRGEGRRSRPAIADEAMAVLCAHSWPGNVRELRNVIERALLLCGAGPITAAHLPTERLAPAAVFSAALAPVVTVPAARPAGKPAPDRAHVLATLAACGGNQSRAAKLLGVSRKTLIARLESYGAARPRKIVAKNP